MPMEAVTLTPFALALAPLGVHKEPKMTLNPPDCLEHGPKNWDANDKINTPRNQRKMTMNRRSGAGKPPK